MPRLGGVAEVSKFCDSGAHQAAEQGLIEEEDLAFLKTRRGESDALGRRAIEAGNRGWDQLGEVGVYSAREVLNAAGAEMLGIGSGTLILTVGAKAEDLGGLALDGHRHRIMNRVRSGDFGAELDLPAAPVGSEEAEDLWAATNGISNFADGRAALTLYALREALSDVLGGLKICTSCTVGGLEERGIATIHRKNLAGRGVEEATVCGGDVVSGTEEMLESVPSFVASKDEGATPWEEAEILERWVDLESLGRNR